MRKAFYDSLNETLYIVELEETGELSCVLTITDGVTLDTDTEEEEEEEETDSVVENIRKENRIASVSLEPKKKTRSITGRSCGQTGHFAKTCPRNALKNLENPVERMKLLVEQGLSDQEIYNEIHDSVTDAQFREYLEVAKSN